jgi:prolycopene isomerase
MTDYDAVVIGAGNGGLTAACTLAQNGAKVLLLERHNIPGGCATSFVRGRFEFEVALHQLSGLGSVQRPGPLRTVLGEMGVLDKIEFVEMKNLYRLVVPGTLDLTLSTERDEIVDTLTARFPREGRAILSFFDLVYEFAMQMVMGIIMKDPEFSPEKYPTYFKYALKPSQEILDGFFTDPLLKTTIATYWSYMGIPPRHMSFTDLALLLWVYIEFKPYHMKGGSQSLSNVLLNSLLLAGGEVRFNCAASKIDVQGGQVRSVLTDQGDQVSTKYVVSNAGTLTTYLELMDRDQIPAGQMESYASSTIGTSAFTIYLGLDGEPGDLGIHETTNFITTNLDADQVYRQGKTLGIPEAALLTCYDVSDPDFSPSGTCQAALVTMQYAEPWLAVPPNRYAEVKYQYAEGLLALAEKVFPGLRNRIEEVEAATPLTHMRYLGHPGGAIYGFDQYAKDSNLFSSPRSPIKGLYFAGAWAGSGGFQPTLESGRSAARAILRNMSKSEVNQ